MNLNCDVMFIFSLTGGLVFGIIFFLISCLFDNMKDIIKKFRFQIMFLIVESIVFLTLTAMMSISFYCGLDMDLITSTLLSLLVQSIYFVFGSCHAVEESVSLENYKAAKEEDNFLFVIPRKQF